MPEAKSTAPTSLTEVLVMALRYARERQGQGDDVINQALAEVIAFEVMMRVERETGADWKDRRDFAEVAAEVTTLLAELKKLAFTRLDFQSH